MSHFNELHIILDKTPGKEQVSLRYAITGQPFAGEDRYLPLQEIQDLITDAEKNYYSAVPGDLFKVGRRLYQWLDGDDRYFEKAIGQCTADQFLVLAISGSEEMLHLPWELLHDGDQFLVQRFGPEMVPVRLNPRQTTRREPRQAALEVVFMATSPKNAQPELNFEAEEVKITTATQRLPMNMEVEESGCLEELKLLLNQLGEQTIDIVQLSGHATNDPEVFFITEDAFGDLYKATAEDFVATFQNHRPSLLFLSGCQTGGAVSGGAVPSLAGELIGKNFPAVLAWAKPVYDHTASEAAGIIYELLSQGLDIPRAVHITLNRLLADVRKYPDWHLLRLYADGHIPHNLIDAGNYAKRSRISTSQFLDAEQKVRVAGRREFIGRRRKIQACLRVLRNMDDKLGVVIHGMGGLGKSTLAARLCDRIERFFKPVVLVGKLDRHKLLTHLRDAVDEEARKVIADQYDDDLDHLLKKVFEKSTVDRRFLIVLDDFEQNFEMNQDGSPLLRDQSAMLTSEAAGVLQELVRAIQLYEKDNRAPRLLITTRYTFKTEATRTFEFISLTRFSDSEWQRFQDNNQLTDKIQDEKIRHRCLNVADGNPRLLEWLMEVIKENHAAIDHEELLELLESKEEAFREDVFAVYLLDQQEEDTLSVLACLQCFEVPVPELVVAEVAAIPDVQRRLEDLTGLSLADLYVEAFGTAAPHYRTAEVIKKMLPEPSETEYSRAAGILSDHWESIQSERQWIELTRLAVKGKNIPVLNERGAYYIRFLVDQNRFKEAVERGEAMLALIPENTTLLLALGRASRILGFTEKSLGYFQQGGDLSGDDRLRSIYLHEMAYIYRQRGDVDKAMDLYTESISIKNRIGDEKGKSATLHEMAYIYLQRGDVDKAMDLYTESMKILNRIGDEQGKSATLHSMAYIYLQRGDVDKAMDLYTESMKILNRIGDEKGKSATLHSMAYIYRQHGDVDKAMDLYTESISIKNRIGDEKGKSATLHEMAYIYLQRGDVDKAMDLYTESYDIDKKIGDEQGKSATLHEMAYIYLQRGDVDKAMDLYTESYDIDKKIGDEKGKSTTLHSMATIYRQRGDVDKAMDLYTESMKILNRIGDLQGQANTGIMLAQLLSSEKDDYDAAWEMAKKSVAIFEHIRSANLSQAQEIATEILFRKIENSLSPKQKAIFRDKLKKGEDVLAWAREQGVEF